MTSAKRRKASSLTTEELLQKRHDYLGIGEEEQGLIEDTSEQVSLHHITNKIQ